MSILRALLRFSGYIFSLGLYFITLLSAFGGHVNPNIMALPSLAVLVFPWLAVATVVTALIWLVLRRYWVAILGALVIIASWGTFRMAVAPMHFASDPRPGDKVFTLMTFNMLYEHDLRQPETHESNRSIEYVLDTAPDILCAQEYYYFPNVPEYRDKYEARWKEIFPYRAEATGYDLTVFSRFPVTTLEIPSQADQRYNYAVFRVDIGGRPVYIINVHLATYLLSEEERGVITNMKSPDNVKESIDDMKMSILGKLKRAFIRRAVNAGNIAKLEEEYPGMLIICGDFNDVPGSWAYRKIMGKDMGDAYAATNFFMPPTYNHHAFYFHIDQILYRKNAGLRPLSVKRCSDIDASDHYPLLATFAITPDLP